MKRFYILLILLTGFVYEARMQAQTNVIDEVIWVVGDDAIFLSDVERIRKQMRDEGQRIPGNPDCFIPEQLAINKLYLHQAKLDSIEISDSEVSPYVEQDIKRLINILGGTQEKLEEYFNQPISVIREERRTMMKENEIIGQVKNKIVEKVKISPSDVRAFYNRIPKDSLPFIPTTVEVAIITAEPQVSIEEIDDIQNRLREYTELVNSGQRQFSSLATLYSDDKETSVRGGRIGLTGKAQLVPEFANVAFDLTDTRRVSRIVKTERGYHIMQLVEKLGDFVDVRHILIRERITQEAINAAIQRLDSIHNDIIGNKLTFEEGAFYISADKDTRNNKGLMVNVPKPDEQRTIRSGTSKFEMQELPPEIAKTIDGMQVGSISKPFLMISPKTQKEIVAVVKLKSRIEGHKASLTEDLRELNEMVRAEKIDEALNKWIAKKQKETYIRINDNWKNCDFIYDGWIQK